MASKKIPIQKLTVGMFVEELDRQWIDTPFFFHKKLIKNHDQIDKLISNGILYVMIDTDKGADYEETSILDENEKSHLSAEPKAQPQPSVIPENSDPLQIEEELPRALWQFDHHHTGCKRRCWP